MREPAIYGIVEFSNSIFCSADALGAVVDIEIGGQVGTLMFPSLPAWGEGVEDPLHMPLLGPTPARSWKRGDKLISWGWPQSYPTGNASVELALIEFILANNIDERAQQIYEGFKAWLELFEKYVALITKQGTYNRVEVHHDGKGLELLIADDNGLKHVSDKRPHRMSVVMSDKDESLHHHQLNEIAHYSSRLIEPKFEYKILLEAYHAQSELDHRKAIIEAANALEICLTSAIMEELNKQNIKFGDKLLQKYRMLGGRFELIKLLEIDIPDKNYEELIIRPRNNVVHRGYYPSRQLSYKVVSEVEELLRIFSPSYYSMA